jgi:hypothetical protein
MNNTERFIVSVAFRMGVSQTSGHAADNEYRQFPGQHSVFVDQLLGELFQVHTSNQFHRDEIDPTRLTEVIRLDNVGVDEIRNEFGFANEIIDELFLICVILANDLDGDSLDKPLRALLLRFIHYSHSALKNFADDFITKLVLYGEESHKLMLSQLRQLSSTAFGQGTKMCDFIRKFFIFLLAPLG